METTNSLEKGRISPFAPDGYEWDDAPEELSKAMASGTVMPKDFLPAPNELVLRQPKRATTIRLDADVIDWFKSFGKGYQTRINAVLQAYKSAHR